MRTRQALYTITVGTVLFTGACDDSQAPVIDDVVAAVTVVPGTITLAVGDTQAVTALVRNAGGQALTGHTITWQGGEDDIAVVTPAGMVIGVAVGSTQLTASSGGKEGHATIVVEPPPLAALVIAGDSVRFLEHGGTVALAATGRDARGRDLDGIVPTWSTSDGTVAVVDTAGFVVAGQAGSAVVTATAGAFSASVRVQVAAGPIAALIIHGPPVRTMERGTSTTLIAVGLDAAGSPLVGLNVDWTTSDESVASVSSTGGVVIGRGGTAIVTATFESFSASVRIRVPEYFKQ
jgi:trimeric autotransporter adhesin